MENQERYLLSEISMPSYDRNKCYTSLEPYNATNNHLLKSYQHLSYSLVQVPCEPMVDLIEFPDRMNTYIDNVTIPQYEKPIPIGVELPEPIIPKKRGRRPKNSCTPSRHENKMNRNSNKPYVNYKGVEIEPKSFIDYQCKCIKRCCKKLSATDRSSEFEKFWALSAYDAQTAFIAAKVTEHPVKKRYGKNNTIKKDYSRTYSLCSTAVCRDMFCKTLQISSGRINTALTKIRFRSSIRDQRGIKKTSNCNDKRGAEIRNIEKNPEHSDTVIDKIMNQHFALSDKSESEQVPPSEIYTPIIEKSSNYVITDQPSKIVRDIIIGQNELIIGHNPTLQTYCSHSLPPMQPTSASNSNDCAISRDNVPCSTTKTLNLEPPNIVANNRPKKGRKPKFNQSRQENKMNRNSNKAYVNYKGVIVEPKSFVDFKCKCSKKCSYNMMSADRCKEFEKFWALPYDSQTAYIVAAVSEQPVKRRYSQNVPKKDYSRKYALGSIAVCRDMFCRTLHISPGRINTALKKYRSRSALTDQRGIKQGGHNKLPAEKRNCVIRFIKRIPVYRSHYCKEKSKSRFLPPEMTLAKLYELYKEEEKDNSVSNASFKKIFYSSFNLRAKETCYSCDALKMQLRKEHNGVKKLQIKQKYDNHRALAEKAQKYLDHDILLAKKYPEVECITFEMERTLPLPRIPTNAMCYKRLLWLYNLGVHSSSKDQSYCYIWPEGQAGKGAQEVGSCVLKHAKEEIMWSPDLSHLILWTDACGGLNRNVKLTLMLKSLLQSCPTLKSIKLKFLVSGHSSLPNQRDFSDIERALKNQNPMYLPDDYVNVMRYCRKKKPLIVKSMTNQDFLSTEQLEKHILNSKISTEKQKVNWLDVREISMFVNDPYTIYLKTDFEGEAISMDLQPRPDIQPMINFMHLLVPLWPLGKPITPAKLKDLKSMLHLIPAHAKNFYSNLQCGSNNDEDVDGLNEELDFEIEYNHK